MEYVTSLINHGLDDIVLGGDCFKNRQPKFEYSKYKFYFALENAWNCRDYITEKFFYNGLISGAVPVVMGPSRDDYEAVSPPNSFIYAKDFSTPKKLVEYLKYLNKNDTAYKEYLKWTTDDLIDIPGHQRETDYCQLCRILHGINIDNIFNPIYQSHLRDIPLFGWPSKPRIVPSLAKWFYGTENSDCLK
uniref:Fucosyltransferase n=1 Tax=Phallusia mammillata TaxID=59560 RepID=A0A6F9DE15_9ASCI|nr:alpha-(1,3)-fucosyltransferase 6-like [Phallusia mammillata]